MPKMLFDIKRAVTVESLQIQQIGCGYSNVFWISESANQQRIIGAKYPFVPDSSI